MPLTRRKTDFKKLSADEIDAWRGIPPSIVSDCMNRTGAMAARIAPLTAGTTLAGQARTVRSMVGDNSASHRAIGLMEPGEVLVVDAGGASEPAVWGAIMTHAAIAHKIAGVVIDGSVRDAGEIRELGFPCYVAGITPAGPHKGFGGEIDTVISCGGCTVRPGDVIVGDDDGIAVVPLEDVDRLLQASRDKIAAEEETIAAVKAGLLPAERLGIPEPDVI
ncbi:MAG: RraA family protein [Methyloligellaceae bacterium]